MRLPARTRSLETPPGVAGTARVDRRTRGLLPRLRAGDIVVIDHIDLDRGTAQTLVDAGVAAVVNASPMISGRYPNLGPGILADAGIVMLDRAGPAATSKVRDGASVRLHEGELWVGDQVAVTGHRLEPDEVAEQLSAARAGLLAQLETFTHNSSEFMRREQDTLLHGLGLPALATRVRERPVVVVTAGHDHRAQLRSIRPFLREQQPVLIGVDRGAEVLREAGFRPDIVVLDPRAEEADQPTGRTVKAARDVVVRLDRGADRAVTEPLERLGVRPLRMETAATPEDAALLLAHAGEASIIIGVGLRTTLEDFLDRQRPGLAGTYLTRLKVGSRLVDAGSVPHLYSGRVRPRHLYLVMLAGLVALAAAVAVTPVGAEWVDSLRTSLSDLVHALVVRGPLDARLGMLL